MLNSKDEVVQSLKEHFKALGIGVELSGKKIIIRDNLFNASIIIHLIIALLGIEFMSAQYGNLHLLPVLFLYAIIAYTIFWIDYRSINIIEFDLLNKNILIKNRSVVRRLVTAYIIPQPIKYYFQDCRTVEVTNNKSAGFYTWARYFVNIKLKDGASLQLINFSEEVNAVLFSKFVMVLID